MYQYPHNAIPADVGYRIAYHPGETNVCPACSKSHWLVGRMTAECAFCATALPIDGGGCIGPGLFWRRGEREDGSVADPIAH